MHGVEIPEVRKLMRELVPQARRRENITIPVRLIVPQERRDE
jgi:hypothetical protein